MTTAVKSIDLSKPNLKIDEAVIKECNKMFGWQLVSTFTVAHILYMVFQLKDLAPSPADE